MRPITILLFLLIFGCKNESKNKAAIETETESENGMDKSVYAMWNSYIESNPESKGEELPDSGFFHNTREDAKRLGELILQGEKSAGSSLYFWFEVANAELPKIGTKNIVTDFDGKAIAIIETISVDTIPFNQVSKEYAEMDMGTKIEPLKKWKKAHWDFFASAMEESGQQPTEEMLIVCERFETIWPKE